MMIAHISLQIVAYILMDTSNIWLLLSSQKHQTPLHPENSEVADRITLTPKGPRHFLAQKLLKTAIFVAFIQETKKNIFLESNHRILYFTCLRSCGKNFMKFDCTDWKILALKVGIFFFLITSLQFQMTLTTHLWNFFAVWTLNLNFFMLNI